MPRSARALASCPQMPSLPVNFPKPVHDLVLSHAHSFREATVDLFLDIGFGSGQGVPR